MIDRACVIPEGMVIGENAEEDARRFYRSEEGIVLVTPRHAAEIGAQTGALMESYMYVLEMFPLLKTAGRSGGRHRRAAGGANRGGVSIRVLLPAFPISAAAWWMPRW